MPVLMQLSRIIISEINEQQVIYLREVDGERQFPILIGIFEATSIDRRVKEITSSRPLTHDLIVNIVEQMGGEMESVVITELRDHIYFAKLRIKHGDETIEIDARPSDAIAVAVTCNPALPIYVHEDVLDEAIEQSERIVGCALRDVKRIEALRPDASDALCYACSGHACSCYQCSRPSAHLGIGFPRGSAVRRSSGHPSVT